MRPTRAGLGIAAAVILSGMTGRVLGLPEMFVLAAVGIGALLFAFFYILSSRLNLTISRTATPAQVRVGATARVDLSLLNPSRRATPVIHLHDPVGDGSDKNGASLMLAPVRGLRETRVAYRLPTISRGALAIGPLHLTFTDPLGLFRSRVTGSDATKILVHPELLALHPLHSAAGNDPTAERQPLNALANSGEEFFALRPYVFGDELKRVNWRATARLDELVVRQEESPKTGRVNVLLDVRRESYDAAGFERAVSAALSILYCAFPSDDALRLITSHNTSMTDIRSRHELNAVDKQMATIQPQASASLVQTLEQLAKGGQGGTMVIVTGFLGSYFDEILNITKRRFGRVIVVSCQQPDQIAPTYQEIVFHYPGSGFVERWKGAATTRVTATRTPNFVARRAGNS